MFKGLVRKVDKNRRVSLPKTYCDILKIEKLSKVEILCTDEYILIKKYNKNSSLKEEEK